MKVATVLLATIGVASLMLGILIPLIPLVCGAPALYVERNVVDFGALPENSAVAQEIRISNRGNRLLSIRAVNASCSCTQLHLLKNNLAPGESTMLRVTMDTGKLQTIGRKAGSNDIVLFSNDPDDPAHRFLVKFGALGESWLEPPQLDFGRIDKRELPYTLTCKLLGKGGVKHANDFSGASVNVTDPFIHLDTSIPAEQDTKKLRLTLSKDTPSGELFSRLKVTINGQEGARCLEATILGYVRGRFFARPKILTLGPYYAGEGDASETIFMHDEEAETSITVDSASLSDALSEVLDVDVIQDQQRWGVRVKLVPEKIDAEVSDRELCGYLRIEGADKTGYREAVNVPVVVTLRGSKLR